MASDVSKEDEEDRAAAVERPAGAVALADETGDELPALLAIAVGVAILAIAIVWPSLRTNTSLGDEAETVAVATTVAAEEDHDEPAEVGLDLPAMAAGIAALGIDGVQLSADGAVVTASGEVADEASRSEAIAYLQAQPGVEAVIDELTIAEAPVAANGEALISAAQAVVVLTGTVPDEATSTALYDRAAAVYSPAQVENQLVIDPALAAPTQVRVVGALTDPVLHGQLVSAFDGIDGVAVDASGLALEESGELETSMNSLEPIQFASGSARIDSASNAILDEGAAFLAANPDVAIEIGGHTDSLGGDESNQKLSQDRADAVKAALEERGVTNTLTAVGFGERRLKNDPDGTPELQAENRRIEFRITG